MEATSELSLVVFSDSQRGITLKAHPQSTKSTRVAGRVRWRACGAGRARVPNVASMRSRGARVFGPRERVLWSPAQGLACASCIAVEEGADRPRRPSA